MTPAELAAGAPRVMTAAREATATLMRAGLIPAVPEDVSAEPNTPEGSRR